MGPSPFLALAQLATITTLLYSTDYHYSCTLPLQFQEKMDSTENADVDGVTEAVTILDEKENADVDGVTEAVTILDEKENAEDLVGVVEVVLNHDKTEAVEWRPRGFFKTLCLLVAAGCLFAHYYMLNSAREKDEKAWKIKISGTCTFEVEPLFLLWCVIATLVNAFLGLTALYSILLFKKTGLIWRIIGGVVAQYVSRSKNPTVLLRISPCLYIMTFVCFFKAFVRGNEFDDFYLKAGEGLFVRGLANSQNPWIIATYLCSALVTWAFRHKRMDFHNFGELRSGLWIYVTSIFRALRDAIQSRQIEIQIKRR